MKESGFLKKKLRCDTITKYRIDNLALLTKYNFSVHLRLCPSKLKSKWEGSYEIEEVRNSGAEQMN